MTTESGGGSKLVEFVKKWAGELLGGLVSTVAASTGHWWAFLLPLQQNLLVRALIWTLVFLIASFLVCAAALDGLASTSLAGPIRRGIVVAMFLLALLAVIIGVWRFHVCEVAWKVVERDEYSTIREYRLPMWYGFTFAMFGALIVLAYGFLVDLRTGKPVTRFVRQPAQPDEPI